MNRWFIIAFVLGLFLFSAFVPLSWIEGLSLCYFRTVAGLDCPGCGLTRAFAHFFKGHFREAIALNALAPVLILWMGIYALQNAYTLLFKEKPRWFSQKGNHLVSRIFIVLFLGQWAWKSYLSLWG